MKSMDIKFEKAEGYKNVPITGVIGTLTPQGFVQAEFFSEKLVVLKDMKLQIDENGRGTEVYPEADSITREAQICFFMRPEAAKSIGQWLLDKAEEATKSLRVVK